MALNQFRAVIYQHETYFCLMGEQILISICIPAYNRVHFLKRLLDSISIQSFHNFEVIITDDSPGQDVCEVAKSHPISSKIRYFKNPVQLGTPENWNEGLRKATGDWIKIMHDDDWFSNADSLKEFAGHIRKTGDELIFSAYTNVYPNGTKKNITLTGFYLNRLKKSPDSLFASNRIGPPSVVLFKKNSSLYFDNRMKWLVDIDFYITYLKNCQGLIYIKQPLVQVGISESQVTQMSFGNPDIEIPERKQLFEKLGANSIRYLPVYDQWWRFIRNFRISNEKQLNQNDSELHLPNPIISMIRVQNRIPPGLLKIGVFSKSFMLVHYIYTRLRFS